jgi:phage terminase large subunit GpA-like protein
MPPLLPQRPSLNNKSRTPFWPVGVNAAKIAIYDRLTLAPGTIGEDGGQQASPRACHFPNGRGYDDVYFEQLVAEKMVTKYQFGQAYRIFEKPTSGTRNEALDCRCYGLAALHSLGIVAWGKVRENLVKAGESRRAARPALVETPTLAPEKAAASAATVAASLAPLAPAKPAPVAPLRQVPARSGSGYIGGWRKY